MHHSMKPHPAITATLLDFMCRVSAVAPAAAPSHPACAPGLGDAVRVGLPRPRGVSQPRVTTGPGIESP